MALADDGAAVAGIEIAGPVSSILDFEPASPADLAETRDHVKAAGGR